MKKKLLLSMLLFFALLSGAWAQTLTVTGRVTNAADGAIMPGVSIVEKGTTNGTATGADGQYQLTVQQNATLIFRFIGMITQEVEVQGRTNIDLQLLTNDKFLNEVVITGYTVQNQREVAGSVETVKSEEISRVPIGSFDQALQGRVPGLLVQAQSGQPGAAASVIIRGRGSVLGDNNPLYIMDGIQITAADFATLNAQDFESITVLKDAAATSIYGSRGANGVIVISTRKGRAGKTSINYDTQFGFSEAPQNKLELMNTSEKLIYELRRGNPNNWNDNDIAQLSRINTDWEKVFFGTGKTRTHTLSATGGSEKTKFYLSGSVFNQSGIVKSTELERYTVRANVSSTAGNVEVGINSAFGYSEANSTIENDPFLGAPLNAIRWANPYETPYTEDGRYSVIRSGMPNPLQELLENNIERDQIRAIGNIFVNYQVPFLDGLALKANWGADFTSNELFNFTDPSTYSGFITYGSDGNLERSYLRRFRYTGTNSIVFDKDFNENHSLAVSLFQEIVGGRVNSFGFTGYGLSGPFKNESGITPGTSDNGFIPSVNGDGSENVLLSYFADVNYGLKGRYFLTLGARRDGSSRFGKDRRYANFGSVGLSWIFTDEALFSNLAGNFLSEGKLKVSYGASGNQSLAEDFISKELYERATYDGATGLIRTGLPNPQLQWESRATFNAGLEFSFFNGRLGATAEYYNSTTSDLFLNRKLSQTSGTKEIITNVGELRNKGLEFNLEGIIMEAPHFKWSANISMTHNQSTVTKLYGDRTEIEDGFYLNKIGQPMYTYFLVRYAGVNPDNGDALYLTKDGEKTNVYNPADRVLVGSAEAPYFGGFGTSISYKGITLDAFFTYVRGHKIFNNDRANVEYPLYVTDNLSKDLLREWQRFGDKTDIPRADSPFIYETTRFLEDGDFVRLRNLTLSYELPEIIKTRIKAERMQLFAQAQNLITWTDFRGADPEISTGSLMGAQYPALRTITFGLNVGF